MNFEIKVKVKDYNPLRKKWEVKELTGEYLSDSEEKAILEAKEINASELGVSENDIEIVSIRKI